VPHPQRIGNSKFSDDALPTYWLCATIGRLSEEQFSPEKRAPPRRKPKRITSNPGVNPSESKYEEMGVSLSA
jgi:hypothetical protein